MNIIKVALTHHAMSTPHRELSNSRKFHWTITNYTQIHACTWHTLTLWCLWLKFSDSYNTVPVNGTIKVLAQILTIVELSQAQV